MTKRLCPNCGAPLQDSSMFCTDCGKDVSGVRPVVNVPVAQEHQTVQATPVTQTPSAPASAPAKATNRKTMAVIVGIAVAVIVVIAIACALALSPKQDETPTAPVATSISSATSTGSTSNDSSTASTTPSSATNANAVSNAIPHEPFWGVWGLASKNEADCAAEVERLKKLGYSGAFYVLTTDWAGLNSEPWYAVTSGKYGTPTEARHIVDEINANQIMSDAYAKYSGAYQGN